MTLTTTVAFKATLQKGDRFQIPRPIRWQFKLEPKQVLEVTLNFTGYRGWETFYACMTKDGRIAIPKITCQLLKDVLGRQDLHNLVFSVELAPPVQEQTE